MKFDKTETLPCRIKIGGDPDCPADDNDGGTGTDPRCLDPVFKAANPEICGDDGIPDPRCEDPAFRIAHPEICDGYPILIIKPGSTIVCIPRAIQFKTYLYADGVETEVTAGVHYQSSDPLKLLIGGLSGNATPIDDGMVTVTSSWQGKVAFAQVTIMSAELCCDDTKVGMLMLVDGSESMKRLFGPPYGRRIDVARHLAAGFLGTINVTKDVGAVMRFDEAGQLLVPFTDDIEELQFEAGAITATGATTDIAEALRDAIDYVESDTSLTHRVIILITDGDDHGPDNPVEVATQFVSDGGVILTVGLRAYGDGYDDLVNIGSSGFFVNALPSNNANTLGIISGMKGYFCAGNCVPPGDVTVAVGKLDYNEFEKWDVPSPHHVDLLGGNPPYQVYDFLPGNGMYLDMHGSSPEFPGKIVTKAPIDLAAGDYTLRFKLAGNQREEATGVLAVLLQGDGDPIVDEDFTVVNAFQDFTLYTIEFTVPDATTATLSFEQTSRTGDSEAFGLLLDDIRINFDPDGENTVVFEDDFDTENTVYIPPECGNSIVLAAGYSYDCYGDGCLTVPPGAQTPDPNPVADEIEVGTVLAPS